MEMVDSDTPLYKNENVKCWLMNNCEKLNKNDEDNLFNKIFPDLIKNKNKYGIIGERIFEDYLKMNKIKYQKQVKIGKFVLDFETDECYYEIKTRRYNMSGTAGEKILYPGFKYRNIIDKKPLKIIFIGYQEFEMSELLNPDERAKDFVEFYNSMNVYFIPFTEMICKHKIIEIKPFVKWVGGKNKIVNEIIKNFNDSKEYYLEPFLGGGSVLLKALNLNFKHYIVNDLNADLISAWLMVRDNCEELITELKKYESQNTKEDYIKLREEYNKYHNPVLFIYLNKTCFRGMYRVNKFNNFNVPYGNYKTLNFDYNNLRNISIAIKDVVFENLDYKEFLDKYKDLNSFVYMDPPYYETFNSYTTDSFDSMELKKYTFAMKNYLLSNSKNFLKLFKSDEIDKLIITSLTINDSINSKNPAKERCEILIKN